MKLKTFNLQPIDKVACNRYTSIKAMVGTGQSYFELGKFSRELFLFFLLFLMVVFLLSFLLRHINKTLNLLTK